MFQNVQEFIQKTFMTLAVFCQQFTRILHLFVSSFLSTNPMVKAATHLSSVETVSGGAAPFGPALIEKFMAKCAPNVVK